MNYKYFKLTHKDNNLSSLVFDFPKSPINKLSFEVLKELELVFDEIENNKNIKVLAFSSAKKDFIVGADIKEIKTLRNKDDISNLLDKVHSLFLKIENLKCKTIAIIDGYCLGGGLELALCFDYRIASSKSNLGFPETQLGIIPGFGGTYRSVKLIGLQKSLQMILTAKNIDANKSYRFNLVDAICDTKEKVDTFIDGILQGNWTKKRNKPSFLESIVPNSIVFSQARKNIFKKTNGNYPALDLAIDVIEKNISQKIEQALRIERDAFCELAVSDVSKNLIEIFLTSKELKSKYTKQSSLEIKNTAVIGSGIMGSGIIWLMNRYDFYTRVKLLAYSELSFLMGNVQKLYGFYLKTRKMKPKDVLYKMDKLSYSDNYDGFKRTDLVIEAIFEDLKLKQDSYQKIEENASEHTIIASNTSSISITKLASKLKNKENFVGIHFFNPVNRMPLVEIIPTEYTSKRTIEQAVLFVQKMNKTPVIVKDCSGFLVNRLLMSFINEAMFILEEGSSVLQIDEALKKFGMPMGAFRLLDEIGIDIGYHVASILQENYGERMKAPKLTSDIFEAKLLGKKSKKGFYKYDGKNEVYNEEIDALLGDDRKSFDDKYIIERVLFALINEATKALEENVVPQANILDFTFILGTGFPPFRGGILKYADSIGLGYIIDKLKEFQNINDLRFEVSKLLIDMNNNNDKFYKDI